MASTGSGLAAPDVQIVVRFWSVQASMFLIGELDDELLIMVAQIADGGTRMRL